MRIDWKLPVLLIATQIVAAGIQWGIFSAKLDELFRDQTAQERHIEYIDEELRARGIDAGSAKEFHEEVLRRLAAIDAKLERR